MAQPLTSLQSRLFLALNDQMDPQAQQLLSDLSGDVDHLSALFRLLQRLVCVQGAPGRTCEVPCSSWIDGLVLDAEAILAGTGISFEWTPQARLPAVRIDRQRTRQAILDLFAVAGRAFRPGALVSGTAAVCDSWVEFTLTLPGALSEELALDDLAKIHLALAEAASLSQAGTFSFLTGPLRMTLGLPIASFSDQHP